MSLTPPSLDIPLHKRDWAQPKLLLMSMGCAWLWHRPMELPQILISLFVGGGVVWLTLGPGLSTLKHHPAPIVRGITFIACLATLLVVMWFVVPALFRYAT